MNNDIDKDILNSSLDDDNILKKKIPKAKIRRIKEHFFNHSHSSCNNYFICRCKRFPAGY